MGQSGAAPRPRAGLGDRTPVVRALSIPNGLVGITKSEHLPAFRVQPRAEFIHGEGCGAVLDFFDDVCALFTASGVTWSLSRLDLFCDLQGWDLAG